MDMPGSMVCYNFLTYWTLLPETLSLLVKYEPSFHLRGSFVMRAASTSSRGIGKGWMGQGENR